MPELIETCDMIIGDMDVMETYFQLPCTDMHDGFKKLADRFPNLEYIGLTERAGFSATHNTYQGYIYHRGVIEESKKYDLPDIDVYKRQRHDRSNKHTVKHGGTVLLRGHDYR